MNDPQEPQKIDVGSVLRKKRQMRGLSHETVHQHTRIPKKLLDALENNDPHAFAAPVYLRGFLKGYCEYLELDFEPLWKELSGQVETPEAPARPEPSGNAALEARRATPPPGMKKLAPNAGGGRSQKSSPSMMLPLTDSTMLPFLIIIGLLVAGGLLWVLMRSTHLGAPAHKLPPPPPPPAAVAPTAPAPELSLLIIPERETWIRVASDGALRFEGRIPAGARQEWKARKGFSLRAVRPSALRVLLDGATVQLGTLPKDGRGDYQLSR
ncbi:MAG: RodZ domain-containing protein [Elusimicrobiota bacterium]|jgi:hypothetical protein